MTSELDEMNCREVFERLDDFMDRALDTDELERVAEHLERCSHCADEHELSCCMVRGIKAKLSQLRAPEGLKARIGKLLADCAEGRDDCDEDAPPDPS